MWFGKKRNPQSRRVIPSWGLHVANQRQARGSSAGHCYPAGIVGIGNKKRAAAPVPVLKHTTLSAKLPIMQLSNHMK